MESIPVASPLEVNPSTLNLQIPRTFFLIWPEILLLKDYIFFPTKTKSTMAAS